MICILLFQTLVTISHSHIVFLEKTEGGKNWVSRFRILFSCSSCEKKKHYLKS